MKNYRRRKFTADKFFVEGQICKIFLTPQKEFEKGFWLWHVGFAVGKSNRQLNDWYWRKKNKRARSIEKKITGKNGVKTYLRCFKTLLKLRWVLPPGDVLYCDCTSLKADKQFKAGLRWFKKNSEWAVDYDNKIFFWHRPPYFYDPLWKTHIITGIEPANPLQSMESSQYFDYFSATPIDPHKARSKHQN